MTSRPTPSILRCDLPSAASTTLPRTKFWVNVGNKKLSKTVCFQGLVDWLRGGVTTDNDIRWWWLFELRQAPLQRVRTVWRKSKSVSLYNDFKAHLEKA